MGAGNFKKKLHEFFIGKQPLKKRVWTAFFPALSLSFILFLFGPLDLSHIGEEYVSYTVLEILPACLKLWAVIFAALFIITWLAGGKLHVWIASFLAGLAAAFYVQGNYLNIDLGALNGEAVEWQKYGDNALAGLAIFILIVLIPFIIHFFSRKVWKTFVIFIPLLLVIMQLVPLGMMLVKEYKNRPDNTTHYVINKDKEFVLGKENIVVFILDYTSPAKMKSMLSLFPNALEPFHDFLQFDNYNSDYVGTFPAATYLLTHEPYDGSISMQEWFKKAWHSEDSESFYGQMKDAGWNTRIFNNVRRACGTLENEYGLVSNIEKAEGPQQYTINRSVFRKLIKLSFYRYFPLIMKAPFWLYTAELNGMKNLTDYEKNWDRIDSLQKYLDERLSVGDEEKVYVSYHWAGAHEPFYVNEYGQKSVTFNGKTDMEAQLAGHFYIISEYIQQMKDYHIYDDSTIIITTDHGDYSHSHSILFIKPAGQRQDEMTVNHAPISQSEFMETIAEFAGLEKGQFGQSFYDIPEDEERYRCTNIRWYDPKYPEISGKNPNALRQYCYYGDEATVHRMIENKEYESIPFISK